MGAGGPTIPRGCFTPAPASGTIPARGFIMSTSTAVQRAPHAAQRTVYWLSAHWLLVFNAIWGVFVVVPWLAPVFMRLGLDGLGRGIYFVY